MPEISRRQCQCACHGTGTETYPTGTGLPDDLCSACSNSPCAFNIDFGCCVRCDGLTGGCGFSVGDGLLMGKHVTEVFRDGCLFEDHCRYTARDYTGINAGTGTGDCEDPGGGGICGWYDRYSGCHSIDSIADCTTLRWDLQFSGSSATLIGYGDHGTVTYQSRPDDPWVCPTPGVESVNRLWMTDYPDTLPGNNDGLCGKFPQMVCVSPGAYGFSTVCDSIEHMLSCCDTGAGTACFRLVLSDCGVDVVITTYRSGNVPGNPGSQPETPDGVCGFFWGYTDPCPGTGTSQVGLLVWCDGTDWKVRAYCLSDGVWTRFCDTTATLVQCCPVFGIAFTCQEPGTGTGVTACCCTSPSVPTITVQCCPDPIPQILHATVTAVTGTCAFIGCPVGTTYTLTVVTGVGFWCWRDNNVQVNVQLCCIPTGPSSFLWELDLAGKGNCTAGTWTGVNGTTPVVTCSPFLASGTIGFGAADCAGGTSGTVTLVITP